MRPEATTSSSWLSRLAQLFRLCSARVRDESASSVIELAFIFSILGMPLLLGTAEMGFLVYDSIEVSNAAYAGAIYGMQSLTYASNTSAIRSAAQAEAADFGTSLTVTPTTYYVCSTAIGGTQYTGSNAQTNANAACTQALEFVQVSTSVAVTPPVHCPGLPATITLTGSSAMEVEQ
jgi:Flp pilus assembly protein TadG